MDKRIGVFVCECGPNIADAVDLDRVIEAIAPLDHVVVAERFGLLCSGAGKAYLAEKIQEHDLTHFVVGACSPKQHEPTFMGVCETVGMNPFLFQMANIREQIAWITPDKEIATERTIRHLRSALRRVQVHTALEHREIETNPDVLVLGGGIAGMATATLLGGGGRRVYLVEASDALGGRTAQYARVAPSMIDGGELVRSYVNAVEANEDIEVLTNTRLEDVLGFFGNFIVGLRENVEGADVRELRVGAVVVAAGMGPSDPEVLKAAGHGDIPQVMTALDVERALRSDEVGFGGDDAPGRVGILHCIGRDDVGYCSEACCAAGMKLAVELRERYPNAKVTEYVRELSIPGRPAQLLHERAVAAGVEFVRTADARVEGGGEGARVSFTTRNGESEAREVDLAILLPAMRPPSDAQELSLLLGAPLGKGGFFAEEHEKTSPVSAVIEGIYLAGCASGPKGVEESIAQAEAVAGKVLSGLVPGRRIETEAKTSTIAESLCVGCQTCLTVCCYGAISYDETRGVCVVNDVLCKGCGNCAAACPSGAASHQHFTPRQVYQEIAEIVK